MRAVFDLIDRALFDAADAAIAEWEAQLEAAFPGRTAEACDGPARKGKPGSPLRAAYERRIACEASLDAAIAAAAPNVVRFPLERCV